MKALKRSMMLSKAAGLSAIALLGVAGCNSNTEATEQAGNSAAESTQRTVDSAVNSAGQALDNTADAAATTAANAGNVASNAASAVGNAASTAGQAVANAGKNLDDAATITPKVKTALGANAALKGTTINVDTTDQKVTLSGNVKNQTQKGVAATVAKKNAPGYNVVNNLKVAKS